MSDDLFKLLREDMGESRPFAQFYPDLDQVAAVTKNRSLCEKRIGPRISIILNNDPDGEKEAVGIIITGADNFLDTNSRTPHASSISTLLKEMEDGIGEQLLFNGHKKEVMQVVNGHELGELVINIPQGGLR